MRLIVAFIILSVSLFSQDSLYEQGRILYFEKGCNGCHGVKAAGINTYPALANRAKGFLAYKLTQFRQGTANTQSAQIMLSFAQSLNDHDIDAITTFLHDFKDDQKERYNPEFQTWGDGGS